MLTDHEQAAEVLLAGLVEVERYVGRAGWDQPARLFALVPTAELLAADPSLAGQLKVTGPDALSSIEQDDFRPGTDLMTALAQIYWPPAVAGCALSTERGFLPAGLEDEIPADPARAAEFVANHAQRQDLRVVAGALRLSDGTIVTHCVARVASNPDDLLVGADMAPALTRAVAWTLQDNEGNS
ncbi:PPA1309 family protein [Propionimicrobium sp. PCR01-08-3]|uniref:PPA1309 family protein n=1 Tax=Propionimicrobium sp. PCR01-08-3 TaxID=3052086 RepID=UPI00255CA24B|nr:PPA1309 family protein [Propionimicrobium sp. PCR01-08-3]WIY83786.1 PPA1309 family protein [Propionimicrobium sp. PCR01-08-3]